MVHADDAKLEQKIISTCKLVSVVYEGVVSKDRVDLAVRNDSIPSP